MLGLGVVVAMPPAHVPSSHGSLEEGEGEVPSAHDAHRLGGRDDDGFDSDEFREYLATRNQRRSGRRDRDRGDSGEDRGDRGGGGNGPPPPEWDGVSPGFQDWLIKARLWLATTRVKARSQGPMILQKLTGPPFQSFKHWAKDSAWLMDDQGGKRLLDKMDTPEYFGEDREEELLSALSKVTYHLRRGKDEAHRPFFNRWDEAIRKVEEHGVHLPEKYLGFLLVNGLGLSESEIKSMMSFTRGSIHVKDVKEWVRKFEMKLQSKDVGTEKRTSVVGTKTNSAMYVQPEDDESYVDDEVYAIEEALQELQGDDGEIAENDLGENDTALDESEAMEILSTMLQTKKKTFAQSYKIKKARELARGYGSWKGKGSGKFNMNFKGKFKGDLTLEEVKANSRCRGCQQLGHWHKDPQCPKNRMNGGSTSAGSKDVNYIEKLQDEEQSEAIFCGLLDMVETKKYEPEPLMEKYTEPSATSVGARESSDIVSDAGVKVPNFPHEASCGSPSDGFVQSDSMYKDRSIDELSHDSDVCHEAVGFWDLYPLEHPVMLSESGKVSTMDPYPDELCATVDTGCQRMAIGAETLQKMNQQLPEELKAGLIKETHRFRSVHGSSVTNYVAMVPTSLGKKGSILKPAVFDTEESRKAPFLLSLPFLLHCKAVLHLDQSQGLRIHFKQYGFSVPCHLGPTGALRVPLACFMKEQLISLRKAFEQFNNYSGNEFEVLRVATVFGPKDSQLTGDETSTDDASHGFHREQQESKAGTSSSAIHANDDLATLGPQGALPGDSGDRDGDPADQGQGGTVQHLARKQDTGTASYGDCRISRGDQYGDGSRDGECGQLGNVPVLLRGASSDSGRNCGNGQSALVPTQPGMSSMDSEETRSQSRPDLLEMSYGKGPTVQVFPMDCLSTNVDRGGSQEVQPDADENQSSPEVTNNTVRGQLECVVATSLSAHEHHEGRVQCLRGQSEVPGLRQVAEGDGQEVSNASEGDPKSTGDGRSESDGGNYGENPSVVIEGTKGRKLCGQSHGGTVAGVRGVQTIPGVPANATSAGWSPLVKSSLEEERVSADGLERQSEKLIKQGEKVCQQAQAAMKRAEETWKEIMSLIRTADSTGESGLHVFQDKVLDGSGRIKDQKELTKYAQVLQLDEKQARKVAELYNPNRFGPETKRYGLLAGQAFDLELGHDVLKRETQTEIRDYLKRVKPGLLVVSPRCTHFSVMQNMNLGRKTPEAMRQFLQDLRKSKVLLRFAVEMIELVIDYGGVFLFEQPVTSKAWQERWMDRLLKRDGVKLAQCDQCMYDLMEKTDDIKKYYRKPTGWMTNSDTIEEELSRKCDQQHEHQPVLGQCEGVPRSRRAQRYPVELVRAILRGYRKHLALGLQEVRWLHYEELRTDLESSNWWIQQLEIADAEEMDRYIKKIIADEVAIAEKKVSEENMKTEEIYAADDADAEVVEDEGDGQENPGDERERYLPRERPFTVEQLVRRAHNGLGHPSNERLARILKSAGAKEDAIAAAKTLKCSVCEQHRPVRPARQAAPPKELGTNEIVGVDTIYVEHPSRKRRMCLNVVDWGTRFQMVIPLVDHTPGAARRGYLHWVRLFGPPTKVYTDLGKEFRGAFASGLEADSTWMEPGSLEMPTQRSITERAGQAFKAVFSKAMAQHVCQTDDEWRELLDITNMTCNRLINKSGYSPIQRVLGYNPKVPGGIMTGGYNDWATTSRQGGDLQIQRAQSMRLAAAQAFHEADCSQAIRNSLHAGHRPLPNFEVGQLVYFWRKAQHQPKHNSPEYWHGPARVILVSMPSSVWVSYQGYVVKAAPEQLRHASEEETFTISEWIDGIVDTRKRLEQEPKRGYIDLTEQSIPEFLHRPEGLQREEPRQPVRRLHGKTERKEIEFKEKGSDYWTYDRERGTLIRWHQQPRHLLFSPAAADADRPVPLNQIESSRKTYIVDGDGRDGQVLADDWDDLETTVNEEALPEAWIGRTEFQVRTTVGHTPLQRDGREDPEPEDRREAKRSRTDPGTGEAAVGEEERVTATTEPMEDREGELQNRGERRERDDDQNGEEEQPNKRIRTEMIELYNLTLQKMMASKTKKEIQLKQLGGERKQAFLRAIKKEIQNNLDSGAYEFLNPTESEEVRRTKFEKLIQSRYVLTAKDLEPDDIAKAKREQILLPPEDEQDEPQKAKARHVMKGFSEQDAEGLEATTPQVGRESVLFTLQLLSSFGWTPGYLDFTQAFHSGDKINREIYATQPPEGVPGYQPRQVLRLLKTCYGLLDGPYAWYQHLRKVLVKQLGYVESSADPCLYFLRGGQGELQGVISVATDDLLHGGNEVHWQKMQWLNKNYRMGKFSKGDGRFVGKDIKYYKDGRILLHQPAYAQKIQPIAISKERKSQKLSECSEEEITQLRGLLGALSWLSKETRPDLSGRTALLQQTMPRPRVQDMLEANILAKEAKEHADLGITIYPIPMEHLRVGTATDASWGNVEVPIQGDQDDYWEEQPDSWVRVHRVPRRLSFHPGGAPNGPNIYQLTTERVTIADGQQIADTWNGRDGVRDLQQGMWTGMTVFSKRQDSKTLKEKVNEKFLQNQRLASQGGFITFFYDGRMETEEKAYPISIANWRSYRIKRCTVNTLSAECQSMIHGVGSLHWLRFLLEESKGKEITLENWEKEIGNTPCIAVTDSKSLYDTLVKCCNTAAHIEDKRTAIDVTILKRDFQKTGGQVRWIEGTRMLADPLTKRMGSSYLRSIMKTGLWSLSEKGFQTQEMSVMLISAN